VSRVVALSIVLAAIAGCGTRSDFAYADRTAAIDLGAGEHIDPPNGGNATFDAIWIAAPNDVWVGGKNDDYSPVLQRDVDGVWTGYYFDAGFGFGETTRMWAARDDAMWATAGNTILRWDGTSWADAVDSSAAIVDLNGASVDDVWAVGEGIVLHRGAHGWDAMRPVSATTKWTGVAADGSGGAWIVAPDVVAHGDPDGFTSAPTPVVLNAPAIAAIGSSTGSGSNEAWIVGDDADGRAFVERGDGASWIRVDAPIPVFSSLVRVWVVARDDVWIVGDALLHWNGDALHEALCDGMHVVGRDVSASATDVWVLGRCGDGPEGVMHWHR
jgi:hypothetical protein